MGNITRKTCFIWLCSLPLSIPVPLASQDPLPMISFYLVTAVVSAVPSTHEHFGELAERSRLELHACI